MSMRPSCPLTTRTLRAIGASLFALPFAVLSSTTDAQLVQPPVFKPVEYVYTSVGVLDNEFTSLAGVDIQLEPEGQTPILATTGEYGNTEFYHLPNGTRVHCALQETHVDGGLAVGMETDFTIKMTGDGILSYAKGFSQPLAHTMLIDDDGTTEKRYFPEGRTYPLWDINVPPKSGIKFQADVGMLLNDTVLAETLSYYGYPGATDQWQRGLFMRVDTPGGAKLGDDGLGLVMHNYNADNYHQMQLDVVHFAPAGAGDGDARDMVPTVLSEFHVAYKTIDQGRDQLALYYLGGDLPEGHLFFLWREGMESEISEVLSYPIDTPTFDGEKGQGIDVVDLSGNEPVRADACADCTPGPVVNDPSWTCTPPGVSGWTSFWNFGCPGDGTANGTPVCKQYFRPITPIFCDTNGSIELCTKVSQTTSFKTKIDGVEIGTSVTIEKQTCVTSNIEPGPNGCGECVRMNAVGLICQQKYDNWDDVVCNTGGYCYGHTWTKPCHDYDPIYSTCIDAKVSVTRCSRG